MAFARLTGCRGGTGKRPASVACETSGDRDRKRAKDCAHNGQVAAPTVTAPAASVAKRPFNDYEESAMQDTTMGGHAAVTIELGDGEDRGNRVLQSSDLENSVAIISGALRWRSPVKPYKMPRLQGPRLPTAVHSIVNVGPDTDHDDGNYPGQQLAHQQRRPAGCNGCTPQAQQLQVQQGPGPAKMQPHSTQPEWGRLFSALSLGGPARGSQRTDPVWAAATSNRTGGGGRGIGGFDRSVVNSKPGGCEGAEGGTFPGAHSKSAYASCAQVKGDVRYCSLLDASARMAWIHSRGMRELAMKVVASAGSPTANILHLLGIALATPTGHVA
ncbi:hypothetical protein Vretifemale_11719 [Volvox reticuliferus]|uniref:Uncharacterized protein n=1 Tax=Volvox reticuliferus TaxID=1737510 RepID=A0A8J4FQ70_9CHLO|nr:hypothetical protein Vretifemale_11719 [Volvox reticuliferus]